MELRKSLSVAALLFFGLATNFAFAQTDIKEQVLEGCAAETEKYCSQVTLGGGRMLACFYAHEDKLSGWCSHTLYAASEQLKVAVATMDYLGKACKEDIMSNCASVELGQGRVLECLKSHSDTVSDGCEDAMGKVFK